MQITQFIVGSSYATIHSFISYAVPVVLSDSSSAPQIVDVIQPCITTSGTTFAVWLNVLYLAPLTILFVNFFISSYLQRTPSVDAKLVPKAVAKDAAKAGVEVIDKVTVASK